jgi:polysaccharide biosynthesis protein PslA
MVLMAPTAQPWPGVPELPRCAEAAQPAAVRPHRSKIASTLLPLTARWAAIAASAACAVLFLPLGLQTPLGQAMPLLALPVATVTAHRLSRAFDFGTGNRSVERILPAAASLGSILGMLCLASLIAAPGVVANPVTLAALAVFSTGVMIQSVSAFAYDALRRRGLFNQTAVIVGATEKARRLIAGNTASRELDIVGVFDDRLSRRRSRAFR